MRSTRLRAMLVLLALILVISPALTLATPVATQNELYEQYGRVFPDPHGCLEPVTLVDGKMTSSPWAKGNVCAVEFIQFEEALAGLAFLEGRFGRYMQVYNLRTQFGEQFPEEVLQSAGLPNATLERERIDLRVIKVTDHLSPVPEAQRKHFAYSLSIHGIERAGVEGGLRAIEDLVTWAACEENLEAAPACAVEGPFPKPILEPSNSGPTAGAVLDNAVIYFVLANPDGWRRGDISRGGVFYQRYNGNGMDVNRDWPTIGYTEAPYTPFSEPESRGYGRFLKAVSQRTATGKFAGGIDLHGMLDARAFSYTLLGAGQRDYRKNAVTVDTAIRTWQDAEQRLSWSSLIAPAGACPAGLAGEQMCSDEWGTVWDTINYQITGSFGDWMDSPLGLDGVGIDNEMALSHLAPNTVFVPEIEQLHIDGNKGLIYALIASLLEEQPVQYTPGGRVAYVFDPARISNPGGGPAPGNPQSLPAQGDIKHLQASGIQEFRFDVKGVQDGYFNGGLTIEATFTNAGGISPGSVAELVLEYCGPPEHIGDPEGECREVARYFNQDSAYLQAGARIDLNAPRPGPYRIRPAAGRILPTSYQVSFHNAPSFPVPEQAPYDVSRMDFFTELNKYVPDGAKLTPISVDTILKHKKALDQYDTLVIANNFMPGFVPASDQPPVTGTPQPRQSFRFGPADLIGSPVVDPAFKFVVEPGFDNDRMVIETRWELPSDYDVYVEQFDTADNTWIDRGCQCEFINNGERVEVVAPEPGQWRVRVSNFAAAPQDVTGTVTFIADPAPPAAPPSKYTTEQYQAYARTLARFASNGGNLVLTDGALQALPHLGTGIPSEAVSGGYFYAGWMDFNDGEGATYDRHPLANHVNKPGAAEGRATIGNTAFNNRHQTYEPTPLGYYVSESGSLNDSCASDRCDSPNWIVEQNAWTAAKGTVAARTLVRETPSPGSKATTGVSLGELTLGKGRIRVAGALLPDPTEANYHPYGLASYALTYTGYQVFENLLVWQRPAGKK